MIRFAKPDAGHGRLRRSSGHMVGDKLAEPRDGNAHGIRHSPARDRHAGQLAEHAKRPASVRFACPKR